MKSAKLMVPTFLVVVGLAIIVGSIALADPTQDAQAAGQPEFPLPPGWTPADLEAMIEAGTPGKEHEHLAQGTGEWLGKTTMWMFPGAEPVVGECTFSATPIMDGRYIKSEVKGEFSGMGPYHGAGLSGFDKVSKQFVTMWIDNHSTGIMHGTGELSDDGKTLTWDYSHHCPVTKKPAAMREVETITGPDTKTLEMFGPEPKSGQEFQMMRIELTRK